MKAILRTKFPAVRHPFPRLVRPGAYETSRPKAGGYGIGCPTRMTGGILPAPPRRRTSPCASEGGNPSARPRGRAAARRSCHVLAGALTSSRLWNPTRTVRRHPSTPHSQSRPPVRAPALFLPVSAPLMPVAESVKLVVLSRCSCGVAGEAGLKVETSWQHRQFDPLGLQPFSSNLNPNPNRNLTLGSPSDPGPETCWAGADCDYDYDYD